MKKLNSTLWPKAIEAMRLCHLSNAGIGSQTIDDWRNAFNLLIDAIEDERKSDAFFARELRMLDSETGTTYPFRDILEEYFNHLEECQDWEGVIFSCQVLIELFKWESCKPSEYKFRIGNALEKSGQYKEAERFGKDWLVEYPNDLYAVASNIYLLLSLDNYQEAEELADLYLGDNFICDKNSDTFLLAAYKLYDMTDNINAKRRVEQKLADLDKLM